MVQHTLLIKNVASPLLRAELAKLLGDQHKIVSVSYKNQPGKKGGIKYALVIVDTRADLATVSGLIDKKSVNGKELSVTGAKLPHERGSYVSRIARLKQLEKFPSIWPAPTYRNVAKGNPLKNYAFPTAYVHGEKLALQPPKTIKKTVNAPSRALFLAKVPKTVAKKEVIAFFKNAKIEKAIFSKNKKRLNSAFIVFKNAEERKKAQEAVKDKIVVGDTTIAAQESTKFAKQTVEVLNEKLNKPVTAEKKPLSINGIAKKKFAAYRLSVYNHKKRLQRLAAVKKIQAYKQAVAQGKAQPRVVRRIKPKKAIVKPNPELLKKAANKAAKLNKNKKTQPKAKAAPQPTTA
jgi:hypothetical protein